MAKFVKVMEWIVKDNLLEFVQVFQPTEPCFKAVTRVHGRSYVTRLIQGSLPSDEMRKTGFHWSKGLINRCFLEVGMLLCYSNNNDDNDDDDHGSELNAADRFEAINTLAVPIVTYSFNIIAGLEKYLNSTLPIGQVTLKFCLPRALSCLPKFSNSLIIHEPKNGSHTCLQVYVN